MLLDRKTVLLHDPEADPSDGANMQFRLVYHGELRSSGNDAKNGKADHKHDIRMKLHPQIKRLWHVTPFLRDKGPQGYGELTWTTKDYVPPPSLDPHEISQAQPRYGNWRFVPLVREELDLVCGLDILFLRDGNPGQVVNNQGDIDGRLKTLLDALSLPDDQQRYHDRAHNNGDNPLYVLLSNDRLVTKIAVETDQLLDYDPAGGVNQAHVVITVNLRPYVITQRNLYFA